MDKPHVFLDTSVIFAGVLSATGGARAILKLGEVEAVSLWVGAQVLKEIDEVIAEKHPNTRVQMALLLDTSNIQVGQPANEEHKQQITSYMTYAPDAHVLAEALATNVDYFVTLDRKHFLDNQPLRESLSIQIGTPGDFLAWYRAHLTPNL
ncbi:MAG: hypothetical protein Fur0022_13550 [Anaerolineales bacterium]